MNTYYAVGAAMTTREGNIFSHKVRDFEAASALTESFPDATISRVFLTYDEALKYAQTFEKFYGFPKVSRHGENAAILSFETETTFDEKDQKEETKTFERFHTPDIRTYKFIPVQNFGLNELTPTRLNFPTDQSVPAITDFAAKRKRCTIM
jgi:hypothetical protein